MTHRVIIRCPVCGKVLYEYEKPDVASYWYTLRDLKTLLNHYMQEHPDRAEEIRELERKVERLEVALLQEILNCEPI